MILRSLIFFLLLGFVPFHSFSQKKAGQFHILFYNVENLYDTVDDPLKNDAEFLPDAKVSWNSERYFRKLANLSRVITSVDSINFPAIIGIAEAENKAVLKDLVSLTPLKKGNYEVILQEGPDARGIDVGLLYRKDIMKCIGYKGFSGASSFNGRLILYVKMLVANKDTLHLFVNHWKSREGGSEGTEAKRAENATNLRHLADSIFALNPHANIVIMGDFNDEPSDKSIAEILKALPADANLTQTGLYNLLYPAFKRGEGTLYYKDWDVFDQIIVSGNLLIRSKGKRLFISPAEGTILKKEWMLYKNSKGEQVPNRTMSSKEYFGGFSDHLPVYIRMNY